MKRNAIVRIIIYSLLALVLTGVLVSNLLSEFIIDIGGGTEIAVDGWTQLPAAQFQNLQINWAAGKVVVKTGQITDIMILETSDDVIKRPLTFRHHNGTLEINHSSQKVIGPFFKAEEKTLEVTVPRKWICQEMEIDGAGLEVTINGLNIHELSVDGTGIILDINGSVNQLDMDGVGCEVSFSCIKPVQEISLDGAGCVLDLTLPEGCGFQLDTDGFGCDFSSDVATNYVDGAYIYGDGYCKISADGIGCDIAIYHKSAQ